MFKGDASADTDPVDTAPLDGARISHDYEDSQVRGSWKLRDGKGEVSCETRRGAPSRAETDSEPGWVHRRHGGSWFGS